MVALIYLLAYLNQILAQSSCQSGGNVLFRSDFSNGVDPHVWFPEYYSTNGEKQIYTTDSQTLFAADGNMVLRAFKDRNQWKSARVRSFRGWNNFRAEVRFRLDQAVNGAFPAIWMLPVDGIWPRDGEINIMEYSQAFPVSPVQQGVQTQNQNSGGGPKWRNCNPDVTNWVSVAVEQTDEAVSFFCNGQFSGAYVKPRDANINNWPFANKPFSLILNYAIQPYFMPPPPRGIESLSMFISSVVVTDCFSRSTGSSHAVMGSAPEN
ncbi:concanavalin A-like lectin/glucanase domain-containing protein [Globomyces pollinis-pini]|nr:concanavalin A-like lectin/glucanase domain-containing protein [Globomyces pollinis-pini]